MADEDWGDDRGSVSVGSSFTPMPTSFGAGDASSGRTFGGRGRGFVPAERRGGGGGGRGGGGFNRGGENGFGRSFGNRDGDRENGFGGGRGHGENGGERRFGKKDENGEDGVGEDGETKPPPVSYIPPEPTEDEAELYGSGISSGINFSKYDDIPVKVSGDDVPPGIRTFQGSKLRNFLLEKVAKCGYAVPTPVQKHAIPCVMRGRDVMACAQTGSGKTAAFLLPIIHNLLENMESAITDGECVQPQVVVMAPTRELAIQIHEEARKFIHGSALTACIAYGGVQVGHQIRQLLKGAHILVATPGRLIDFMNRGKISFGSIRFVVLDEADRMLDMGFKPEIDKMMNHSTMLPKTERQTLMFSATFPDEIQRMAGQYLNRYLFITVGLVGGACSDVEQRFMEVSRKVKRDALIDLLKEKSGRTVVFVETKRQADYISVHLAERGLSATSIHGDREQRQREEAICDFKHGRMQILVATAVASRGLDIKGVEHVINFDMPKEIDEYVHRIGRTGRLGNRGLATSFYDAENDSGLAADLVRILAQAEQEVPAFLQSSCGGFGSGGGGSFGGQDFRNGASTGGGSQPTVEGEEW